jgi:hypothetical protein
VWILVAAAVAISTAAAARTGVLGGAVQKLVSFDGAVSPAARPATPATQMAPSPPRFCRKSRRNPPEARYNRAIDLLKLGRFAQARDALLPFATGAFGGYHRDDARAIPRSIPDR